MFWLTKAGPYKYSIWFICQLWVKLWLQKKALTDSKFKAMLKGHNDKQPQKVADRDGLIACYGQNFLRVSLAVCW